jgi:hypothetical protein
LVILGRRLPAKIESHSASLRLPWLELEIVKCTYGLSPFNLNASNDHRLDNVRRRGAGIDKTIDVSTARNRLGGIYGPERRIGTTRQAKSRGQRLHGSMDSNMLQLT